MHVDWASIRAKLNHFSQLEDNWDSYGAAPLDPRVCDHAYSILLQVGSCFVPMPEVVPCPDGTVQFEWNLSDKIELEVQVSLDTVDVYYINNGKEIGFEVPCAQGVARLCHIFDELRLAGVLNHHREG